MLYSEAFSLKTLLSLLNEHHAALACEIQTLLARLDASVNSSSMNELRASNDLNTCRLFEI